MEAGIRSRKTMEKTLAGKVALVVGATRGAGRGIATQLGAARIRIDSKAVGRY
jgi:hypothetical protein